MYLGLETLTRACKEERHLHRPEFFRLTLAADRERMGEVLERSRGIQVFDELEGQLTELMRSLHPSEKYRRSELLAAARAHLGTTPALEYGVWVWYPWGNRLVHLLDEAEFVLVRTDRNRNKITRDEQTRLARTKVGIIGLSAGQSVALTMAQERSFGEIRLADFDTLELSNLNRIRSGIHCLGLRKTVSVAREIAEIDPYLKVVLFNDGLTRDTMDPFFTEGGRLDILVEECDSIDVKILARQKAKELRIPVVMDTSDRGLLDVERFDLEPERPILHGLIAHLDLADAARAKTNEEKMPFILPMLDLDNLSVRMKASMLEIEQSVATWPQLATSVVLGGAVAGDICRRIVLGQSTASGRWYLDLEQLIEGNAPGCSMELSPGPAPLTSEGMNRIAELLPISTSPTEGISETIALQLAEAGALAPSAGNNQPWRFVLSGGHLLVFHDMARGFSRLDGNGLIPRLSLGACLENIVLKAGQLGFAINQTVFPICGEESLIAVISIDPSRKGVAPDPLADSIAVRCTNRKKTDGRPIPAEAIIALQEACAAFGFCRAHFVISKEKLDRAATIIGAADRIRLLNPIGHQELFAHEIRWTAKEASATHDGLDLDTLELRFSERAAFRLASDASAIELLRRWNLGNGFRKLSGDAVRGASALVVVSMSGRAPLDMLAAGRASQRLWLRATQLGLVVHPVSSPIFLSHHVRFSNGDGFSATERTEILSLFAEFCGLFDFEGREPAFMMRLGHAGAPTARSLRKPMAELFHICRVC